MLSKEIHSFSDEQVLRHSLKIKKMIPQTGITKSELNFSWTIPQVKLKYGGGISQFMVIRIVKLFASPSQVFSLLLTLAQSFSGS